MRNIFYRKENNRSFYGLPFQGSKSLIATKIIESLPKGKRLVDLFGGGCSIIHCALCNFQQKYEKFLYNDKNFEIFLLIQKCLNGVNIEKKWISSNEFLSCDYTQKLIYSFNNNLTTYLFSKELEEYKHALFLIKLYNDFSLMKKLKISKKDILENNISKIKDTLNLTKYNDASITELQVLQRYNQIEKFIECLSQNKNKIKTTNNDYKNYIYEDEDVVYCDIPYENTFCDTYKVDFNHKEFYDWAYTRPYQIFFSSYEIDDKRFFPFLTLFKRKSFCSGIGTSKNQKHEIVYTNKKISSKFNLKLK